MQITPLTTTKLAIGRGEVYFAPFTDGTFESLGELYLGNTPGFSVVRQTEEFERFDSYGGQRIKKSPLILGETHTANLVTDNISVENISYWMSGVPVDAAQAPSADVVSEDIVVREGRYYQLGLAARPFHGHTYVEPDAEFWKGATKLNAKTNIDTRSIREGRFGVLLGAPQISNGDTITIRYQWRRTAASTMTPRPREVVGSMRFVSTNPVGPRVSYVFPYVRMKPTGQYDLKFDQWQQMLFEVEVRRLNPETEYFYAIHIGLPGYTSDEEAIIGEGSVPLDFFAMHESILDRIVNVELPGDNLSEPPIFQ